MYCPVLVTLHETMQPERATEPDDPALKIGLALIADDIVGKADRESADVNAHGRLCGDLSGMDWQGREE